MQGKGYQSETGNAKISKNIWLLAWTSFFNDISSDMIMPILPMYLQSLGAGALVIGLVGGLRDGIGNILKVFFGYFSDKLHSRKRFIVFGYLFSQICKLGLAFSPGWLSASVISLLERIGKGMRNAPRDALIAESMHNREGVGFGIHRMMDTAGAVVGSILVLLLFWFGKVNFKTVILIAAVLGFLTLVPLIWVRESKRKVNKDRKELALSFLGRIRQLPFEVKVLIIIGAIYYLGELNYMLFITRAKFMSFGKYRILAPLAFYVMFNFLYAIFSVPFGMLFDRIGGKRTILLGYVLMTTTLIGFVFFRPMFGFLLFGLYGISKAALQGNHIAFVGHLSPQEMKGVGIGAFQTITGLAMILGGTIAGILWQVFSSGRWAFVYGASMTAIATILLLIFGSRLEKKEIKPGVVESIWTTKKLT